MDSCHLTVTDSRFDANKRRMEVLFQQKSLPLSTLTAVFWIATQL
jgi:hypothetical protein